MFSNAVLLTFRGRLISECRALAMLLFTVVAFTLMAAQTANDSANLELRFDALRQRVLFRGSSSSNW